jgi:hypothetical protein
VPSEANGASTFKYNPNVLKNGALTYRRKNVEHRSVSLFRLADGTLVGLFQGSYGDRPDVDFILKFLTPGEKARLRTPTNLHWVVDLLLKAETNRTQVEGLIDYFLEFYYKAKPFENKTERNSYRPVTPQEVQKRFGSLEHHGTYSVEYICHVVELFSICEKATPRDKKMFHGLLICLQQYFKGKKDFYQVTNAAAPGYR